MPYQSNRKRNLPGSLMLGPWMQGNVDGAFFGTTFPHLLLMTYPSVRPQRPPEQYVPRVFGFKLHSSALAVVEGQPSSAQANHVAVSAQLDP